MSGLYLRAAGYYNPLIYFQTSTRSRWKKKAPNVGVEHANAVAVLETHGVSVAKARRSYAPCQASVETQPPSLFCSGRVGQPGSPSPSSPWVVPSTLGDNTPWGGGLLGAPKPPFQEWWLHIAPPCSTTLSGSLMCPLASVAGQSPSPFAVGGRLAPDPSPPPSAQGYPGVPPPLYNGPLAPGGPVGTFRDHSGL